MVIAQNCKIIYWAQEVAGKIMSPNDLASFQGSESGSSALHLASMIRFQSCGRQGQMSQ
jgi:hypothetical protein